MHFHLARRLTMAFSALLVSYLGVAGSEFSPAQARFARAPVYSLGGVPSSSTVADFNGDGRSDVLSVIQYNPTPTTAATAVSLVTATASGSYGSPKVLFQLPLNTSGRLVSGDFNGDGKQDFALALFPSTNVASPKGTIDVYLGNGNGTFQSPKIYNFTGSLLQFLVGKVNRDNYLDLILGLEGTSFSISVLLGNADGTFQSAKTTVVAEDPFDLALGDVNLDGVSDITVTDFYNFQELLGNGDGTFRVQTSFAIPSYAGYGNLIITDFNGDGKPDLVLNDFNYFTFVGYDCGAAETPSVFVLLGYGDGNFNPAGKSYDAGNGGAGLLLADLNGDGRSDLAVLNLLSSTVSVLPRTAAGIATSPSVKYAVATTSATDMLRAVKLKEMDEKICW